jgi:hypothetical protein
MSGYNGAISATKTRLKWLEISITDCLKHGLDDDCPHATLEHIISSVDAMVAEQAQLRRELKLMETLKQVGVRRFN